MPPYGMPVDCDLRTIILLVPSSEISSDRHNLVTELMCLDLVIVVQFKETTSRSCLHTTHCSP